MYWPTCVSVFTKECCILRSEFDIQKINVVFVNEFFVCEFDIWVIAIQLV